VEKEGSGDKNREEKTGSAKLAFSKDLIPANLLDIGSLILFETEDKFRYNIRDIYNYRKVKYGKNRYRS